MVWVVLPESHESEAIASDSIVKIFIKNDVVRDSKYVRKVMARTDKEDYMLAGSSHYNTPPNGESPLPEGTVMADYDWDKWAISVRDAFLAALAKAKPYTSLNMVDIIESVGLVPFPKPVDPESLTAELSALSTQ